MSRPVRLYVTTSYLRLTVLSTMYVFGDEPNICSTARSNGLTPSACSKAKRWSPVVSPTVYIGARSLSAIFCTCSIASSSMRSPILSWLSFAIISFADSVLSPIGSLSMCMRPPHSSTSSERQLTCPAEPWSCMETIGFLSSSPRALTTLYALFCISGFALCTAFSSIPLEYLPVSTDDTEPPPRPMR